MATCAPADPAGKFTVTAPLEVSTRYPSPATAVNVLVFILETL